MSMFNFRKKEIIEDPPDEPQGKVEFCDPVNPEEVFNQEKSLEDFINKIEKK